LRAQRSNPSFGTGRGQPGETPESAFESKDSASFFAKKEAKKLLFAAGCGIGVANAPSEQKFFGSFFQKRTSFLS
jgi:hypothetical protein